MMSMDHRLPRTLDAANTGHISTASFDRDIIGITSHMVTAIFIIVTLEI